MNPPRPPARVALATCARLPDLWDDDQLLRDELRARGADVATPAWDDPVVEWSAFDLVVIRSTWDYWHRRAEYVRWARQAAGVSALLNPADVVEWNTHKAYLRDLERSGVPTVPTAWLQAGTTVDLAGLLDERGWSDVVVKPAVSAGAEDTLRSATAGSGELQQLVDRVLADRDVMVQPYVESVDSHGERSLLFVAGELTHAVRRPPYLAAGRYAESVRAEPAPDEVELAELVLRAVPGGPLLYARVDMVRDSAGRPMLMEVELVEPQLFFALCADAVDRMATAVLSIAASARAGSAGRSTTSDS